MPFEWVREDDHWTTEHEGQTVFVDRLSAPPDPVVEAHLAAVRLPAAVLNSNQNVWFSTLGACPCGSGGRYKGCCGRSRSARAGRRAQPA